MPEFLDPQLFHERMGDAFEDAISSYDTQRRIEVLVDEFLAGKPLAGLSALEVGCGLGYFSEALQKLGADLTVCDIGQTLVDRTVKRVGCRGRVADATRLLDVFARESFDLVLSSECIEHTNDPGAAIDGMCAVLRSGGRISLSTPNLLWWPLVAAASKLRLRAFNGYEHFSTLSFLTKRMERNGMRILQTKGLHLFPFQLRAHGLSRWMDARLQALKGLMINFCVLAEKI